MLTTSNNRNNQPPARSELTDPLRNNSLGSVKTEEYQSKIYELSNQVKLLRERLEHMENQKKQASEEIIKSLQSDNSRLQRENKSLKLRVHELEHKLRSPSPQDQYQLTSVKSLGNKHNNIRNVDQPLTQRQYSKNSSRVTTTTTQLMRELLAECNEPNQAGITNKAERNKDQFYEFKSSSDCFEPWLSQLSKQLRVRLKRCLTRPKELLWATNCLQLGSICPFNPSPYDLPQQCKLLLVLTNISPHPISHLVLTPIHAKDVQLQRKGGISSKKWEYPSNILFNEQLKEEIEITVNNIDFRCVQLQVSYQIAGQKQQQLLILSLSKSKLFRQMPYTSPPPKSQRLERVFEYQKRVLSQVEKVVKLWRVVQGREKVGSRFYWKIEFLSHPFWVEAGKVQQKLMIAVRYQNERALAQKVLDEYIFLFQKL